MTKTISIFDLILKYGVDDGYAQYFEERFESMSTSESQMEVVLDLLQLTVDFLQRRYQITLEDTKNIDTLVTKIFNSVNFCFKNNIY